MPLLILLLVAMAASPAAAAVRLGLPVRHPGSAQAVPAPAYQGDLFEVTLRPAAARAAAVRSEAARAAGVARVAALGLGGLDRLAATMGGVTFEPEFPAERPPAPGSDEPDFTTFYLAHLPPGVDLADALERFGALGEVAAVHPVAILPVAALPNDSLYAASWWLQQPTRRDIHAPEAWDVTVGDTSVVVGILDTGVVPYHPDIGGTVAGRPGQIWTNWIEAAGAPGVDDDGNGYIDDIHGWDFVDGAADGIAGEDVNVEDNDPNDFAGHGTACAGLVGALTNNSIGVSGVAWNVRIMPLRMAWASNFSPSGEVRMDYAAKAIRYATRNGCTVINCSWASDNTDGIDAAVAAAVKAGVTVVAAAGNSSPFHYIASRDDALAVAATDSTDTITPFSNIGPYVDLAAPGAGIRSTWSVQFQPTYAGALNGTSFSAPLVSGTAALIQSHLAAGTHRLTPRGVQLRLMETADDIAVQNPSLAGFYGAGRLNAYRAVSEVTGSTATRTRARSVGSPVRIPINGHPRVAFCASNRTVVELDAVTQDTVMIQSTPSASSGDLAAAGLGGGVVGLFCATRADGVFGFTSGGGVLPGWPQSGSAPAAMNAVALGDLDGDGALEVVSGGDDGQLWAWHVNGDPVAGYPIATGSYALQAAPALTDLNGAAGVEIIVAAQDGTVYAYDGAGHPVAGWPVTVDPSPRGPVVGRLGPNATAVIVIAAGNRLFAFTPDGQPRPGFPVTLAGTVAQDPALGDMNGDGFDEIVVPTVSPSRLEVRDTLGVSLTAHNWPRPLSAPPQSAPVIGELESAASGPEVLIMRGTSLLALTHDADSLASFPKPGGAGGAPCLGQADGDPHVEVVAGTGTDSLFYIYDAGPGSNVAIPAPWPTSRGNDGRTGSRFYTPITTSTRPGRVTDLRATGTTDSTVTLAWTATGEDGAVGRPQIYVIRGATTPLDSASFQTAPLQWTMSASIDAGGTETLKFPGLAPATRYWFALKAVDAHSNVSALSNVVVVQTSVGGPLAGRLGIALAPLENPSRHTARLYWQAAPNGVGGRQAIELYDVTGRRIRVIDVGNGVGGRQNWDGRDAEGRSVPAGLYFARLLSGSFHTQARLVLLP